MSVSAELTTRVRLSDPKPDRCAGCFQGAQENVRFVDFDSAIDRGTFVNEQGAVLDGIDDLHLCESCVQQGCEALDIKPKLMAGLRRELKRTQVERDHWREQARDLQGTIGKWAGKD